MGQNEFTANLPYLTTDPLPIEPPFAFNGLSARVFPLRSNLDALQQLVNGYLNIVPPEVGRFRVSVPYVYLSMLDYGQISEAVLGWFAQVEVFFCVPVEWYKVVNGRWTFHDWAVITPFIYVDDDFSVPMGRLVYGFPKALARVKSVRNDWIRNVRAPVSLAQVETAVFSELYRGKDLEMRVFLEVEQAPPMANFGLPPNTGSPAAPWTVASRIAEALGGASRDAMWLAQAMRIFPLNPVSTPPFAAEMANRMGPLFDPRAPGPVLNSLNLKQFRVSNRPMEIAYQGLTNGPMQLMGFSEGGLLNEERMLLGDLSGGHRIKLHEFTTLPIVRKLGLEVARRYRGDGVDVAELEPVMPFWMKANVRYAEGMNLAWRTSDGIWRDGGGQLIESAAKQAERKAVPPRFNTTLASAVEAISGPFQYAGATIRVLPLIADVKRMQAYLDAYINDALSNKSAPDGTAAGVRLSVWHRPAAKVNSDPPIGGDIGYVYLTASSYETVTSKTNNAGDWAKYELSFMIPVKLERQLDDGSWSVEGVGLVPTFNFVDQSIAAIARLEVEGITTTRAEFIRPEVDWLSERGASAGEEQTLLRVEGEVIHAIGEDQKTALEPFLEIFRPAGNGEMISANSRELTSEWANTLRREQGTKKATKARFPEACKVARALALELLGNRTPFALYSLKQIRDVADPARACYQSLERQSRSLHDVFDLREVEENIVVRLRDYPTLRIVDQLGIIARSTPGDGAGVVHVAQPVRPFYVRATIDESCSEPVATRAGTREWTLSERVFSTRISAVDLEGPRLVVNRLAEKLQDEGDPCRMHHLVQQAARMGRRMDNESDRDNNNWSGRMVPLEPPHTREPEKLPISRQFARDALMLVDPQLVIDAVLSREWGNADPGARWRQGRAQLTESYGDLLAGSTYKRAADAEQALYEMANRQMAMRPGSAPKIGRDVAAGLGPLHEATRWRKQLERHFAVLAAWSIFRSDGRLLHETDLNPENLADPDLPPVRPRLRDAPDMRASNLCRELRKLLLALSTIQALKIEGEPSPDYKLSTRLLGNQLRLEELLKGPLRQIGIGLRMNIAKVGAAWEYDPALDEAVPAPDAKPDPIYEATCHMQLEAAWQQLDAFREAVKLARGKCQTQHDAVLNKLSRAYQKPDFCINRDALGPERDDLVPRTLSWDAHWYYGKTITAADVGGVDDPRDDEGRS